MRRKAVLVDVDGTLCNVSSIRHFVATPGSKDFDAFHEAAIHCPPNEQALEFCRRAHAAGMVVVVVTARKERHYASTRAWLDKYMPVPFDGPIMRPDDVIHTDTSVKTRIFRYLSRSYDIRGACDDNPAIVALWTQLGIPVEVIPGWVS